MSNSQEIHEIHSSVKRVICVWDRVLRSTRSPSPQWMIHMRENVEGALVHLVYVKHKRV